MSKQPSLKEELRKIEIWRGTNDLDDVYAGLDDGEIDNILAALKKRLPEKRVVKRSKSGEYKYRSSLDFGYDSAIEDMEREFDI